MQKFAFFLFKLVGKRRMTFRPPLSGNKHAKIVSAYAPTVINTYEAKYKFCNCATSRTDRLYLIFISFIFISITAAGVVPCGGRKKSPRTSSIVQIIFSF